MNDFYEEIETVCASRDIAWCEANCWDECAARAAMMQEREDQEAAA